jgi:hypothetical protein
MPKALRTITPNITDATYFSKGEKDFVAKHKIEVTADANGNGDEVFKASKVKTFDRTKNREGIQNDTYTSKKPIPIDTFVTVEGTNVGDIGDGTRDNYGDGRLEGESDDDFANRCLHEAIEEVNAQKPDEEEDGDEDGSEEESLHDTSEEDDEEEGLNEVRGSLGAGMKKFNKSADRWSKFTGVKGGLDGKGGNTARDIKTRLKDTHAKDPGFTHAVANTKDKLSGAAELQRRLAKRMIKKG